MTTSNTNSNSDITQGQAAQQSNPDTAQDWSDEWRTVPDPFSEKTFEDVLQKGETPHDRQEDYHYVPLSACPALVVGIIFSLKKDAALPSQASVQRLLTKLGVSILEDEPAVRGLRQRKEALCTSSDDRAFISAFTPRNYSIQHDRLNQRGRRINCSVFWWVDGALGELVSTLSISKAQVTVLALIVAISRARSMSKTRREVCEREYADFLEYIKKQCR